MIDLPTLAMNLAAGIAIGVAVGQRVQIQRLKYDLSVKHMTLGVIGKVLADKGVVLTFEDAKPYLPKKD